ncbi:30S ribosomal S17P protein [Fusarium beomiforme]|uniref:30S ribosomal S17P protein n=1 Tax=Fusarium beomiforme TaxID=44412 RepID=A0A9P5ARS1_9HYPO|nr:30S ribosomal S17P protein [Fusarium beomiforme]
MSLAIQGCNLTPELNADLAEATWQKLGRNAELVPDADDGRLNALMKQAGELYEKYLRSRSLVDLEAAVAAFWETLTAASNDDPETQSYCLLYISQLTRDRYEATNQTEDLDKSVQLADEANQIAEGLDEANPQYPLALKFLRARLIERYALTGSESDLERGIVTARKSIQITNGIIFDGVAHFEDLSALLGSKYLAKGAIEDIEEAISMGLKAIELETADSKSTRPQLLARIGSLWGQKSLRTGSLDDMEEGIRLARQAVEEASDDELALADASNSLATLLGNRYSITGALIDIDEAIALERRALKMGGYKSTMLATALGNLAVLLQQRYQRSHELSDLEESTQFSNQALDAMPGDHPDRTRHQHDIGIKLARKFAITNHIEDLDKGIQSLRQAVNNMPKSHPSRAIYLHSLASGLISKGFLTFDGNGVDEQISVAREALKATPESHPAHGELLYGLGIALLGAQVTRKTKTGIEEAITCFESAISQSNAPALCRIQACMSLLPICPDQDRSLKAAKLVMGLIPRIIPRQQDNSDRQSSLAELAGFASDAAAVAIQAAQVVDALELLKQGQDLLGASAEQMQIDIAELEKLHPEYAAEFERLRNEINRPIDPDISASQSTALRDGQALRLYDAGKEFDDLVEKIRQLPKFDTFLQAPGLDDMQSITDRGPIIIINVSMIFCDAIIIMTDGIQTVALIDLSLEEIQQRVLAGERGSPGVLEWLWDTIVCPVLNAIDFTGAPTRENWPHAMIQARKRRTPTRATNKAVLVAMETTPTLSRLAFAKQELGVVKSVCSSIGLETVESERKKAALIEQIRSCKVFHFAGHGCTDLQDPLKSYLCLEDVLTNPLKVGGLLDLNLKDQPPFLAYLSACGTGRIQQEQFLDESVHLVSAFQLAGFQHVIGTLWEVNDEVCVEIAKVTYEGIRDGHMTDQSVAWGLHEASRRLRDKWLDKMDQDGPSRGADDDVFNCMALREPVMHGIRWERRRVRRRAKGKGMKVSFGTKWKRVPITAPSGRNGSSASMSGLVTRGQRLPREASLAIMLRHKTVPAPAWVPFIHYGI